ncbi:hypothetical protein FHS18_002395 [Paenibacillus phyllosphaerae]|uniref:Uncharacterized protein n=1 Tax=Paenibacillus phyllosphaerae TaxID=274593 RepID=A0A7W5AWY3_9BACL|nr:hypothetical protein [Paenibacillus phyllosphaerae]MBB3110328.1 hypothetical protein [Paenibacillus phyllosphaerae]
MIQYDNEDIRELTFTAFHPRIERRDEQWIDIDIKFEVADPSQFHTDLVEPTALVICNLAGTIAQMVPQDEGCDCEFQFTFSEKEQLRAFIESDIVQSQIAKLASL